MKRRELKPSTATTKDVYCSDVKTEPEFKPESKKCLWSLIVWLLLFRTLNALLSYSAFVPDEYWQAIEVAHSMVFGYGYRTWEWHKPIRGFTHPLLYAALYKVLALLGMDWPYLLIVLPRVLHVPIAVVGDYYVLKLGSRVFGEKAGRYALYCNIASWFTFYCITRTLSNSIEACLTPVVLYHWMQACEVTDKSKVQRHSRLYLVMIGISCLVRPTGAILWPPLVLYHFFVALRRGHFWTIFRETAVMGSLTLCWSISVDYYFYGKLVLVQWKFLEFNVLEGYSALYGANSWHWYFTEDCPVILFTSLPLCMSGMWLSPSNWQRAPFWLALWELVVHSVLSHKEHRYVLPVVPVASIYAGYGIVWLFLRYRQRVVQYLVLLLLAANIPMSLYFCLVHQRGTVAVMDYIRNDISPNSSVLFLMPCHTTPYYSHIHQPIQMRFLECPPPIREEYVDVGKQFYANPSLWMESEYPNHDTSPTHIVLFDVLLNEIESFLTTHNYTEVVRLFTPIFQSLTSTVSTCYYSRETDREICTR